jgi:hypothetical protein
MVLRCILICCQSKCHFIYQQKIYIRNTGGRIMSMQYSYSQQIKILKSKI